MMIGSLRLPNSPRSSGLPPLGAWAVGSPAARVVASAARPRAISSSRVGRIGAHDGVHVAQQAHMLRADLDLHAAPAEIELPAAHRHRTGRRDEVVGVIVGCLFRLHRQVVEPDRHLPDQRDRAELAAVDRQVTHAPGDVGLSVAALEEEGHLGLADDDLVPLLVELGVLGSHLPHGLAPLQLEATEVLDALRGLRQEVLPELAARVRPVGLDAARYQDPDAPHRRQHHQQQRDPQARPSHHDSCRASASELARTAARRNAAASCTRAARWASRAPPGCRRQRSCHQTHSAGARRIWASIAAVRAAVRAVTPPRPRPPSSGTGLTRIRCPPSARRSMKAVTIGARVRSAMRAAPGGVRASLPKKGTYTPAPRPVSWSTSSATIRFRRSASRTAPRNAGSSRSGTSRPAPVRKRAMSAWKRISCTCRATTVMGWPRAAMVAARSSQLPTCPATASSPRPCARAALTASTPSTAT